LNLIPLMSDDDLGQIRPKSVPLSHTQPGPTGTRRKSSVGSLVWLFAAGAGFLLLFVVFLVIPDLVAPPASRPTEIVIPVPAGESAAEPSAAAVSQDDSPAPFAALQREQARAKAQEKLSEFVELQLALEESMQVGAWGQAQLDAAKALATEGDEQFLNEEYQASLDAYGAASNALANLIAQGTNILEEALISGEAALSAADQAAAETQFGLALTIDPENAQAQAGLARAALLPEVIVLMRQAKNHELAGDWQAALRTYEQVAVLDPLSDGLGSAIESARSGVKEEQIRSHLSNGFSAMEARQFTAAKRAFNAALKLDPDNAVARGGLEQVTRRTDISQIEQLKESATIAEAAERWAEAIAEYEKVLKLDANIQFAKDGRARATEQYRAELALGKIIATPDKLSSPQLFDQAKDIVARAERLTPRGATLANQLEQVTELIRVYATPVPVVLKSDNATRVTLSTVGVLGAFESKELSLRPGAYTLLGSRDGYRDVRENILVRPDMQPFDIRCTELF
jgi:hypothetical protein